MQCGFTRLVLRTTDVGRAREFYSAVTGWTFDDDGRVRGDPALSIATLPERAAAAGAPSNWLGTLGVPDPEAMREAWLGEGARVLGPPAALVVADPGGAVLALGGLGEVRPEPAMLHCPDLDAATKSYEPCGWEPGPIRTTSWGIRARTLGPDLSAVESVGRTPAHPQWLFSFAVDDLEATTARLEGLGATVVGEFPASSGLGPRRVVLDDPTGAAVAFHDARA